jgi:uncharacterized coiled-coil DUF342 family protein
MTIDELNKRIEQLEQELAEYRKVVSDQHRHTAYLYSDLCTTQRKLDRMAELKNRLKEFLND